MDLVVSGPNYGRNTTSLFSLSSGTIGGAMEAAVCKKRAIALSYAFFSRNHDPDIIAGASRMSVKLVEHLMRQWDDGVDLYSVNVPLIQGIESKKVLYTYALQNYWQSGSSFTEIEAKDEEFDDPEEKEMAIREQEGRNDGEESGGKKRGHKHRHFTWTPKFSDVYQSVETSEPGNDGWAVKEGLVRYAAILLTSDISKLTVDVQCHSVEGQFHACPGFARRVEAVSKWTQNLVSTAQMSVGFPPVEFQPSSPCTPHLFHSSSLSSHPSRPKVSIMASTSSSLLPPSRPASKSGPMSCRFSGSFGLLILRWFCKGFDLDFTFSFWLFCKVKRERLVISTTIAA